MGETLAYACLLYSFGALILVVGQGTGWSKPQIALGLTLALLTAAAVSPLSGRLIDRGYGAELLTGGAVLGGLALLGLSRAQSLWQWYLGWALVGPAMAASFYDTCFAFLTRRLGPAVARPAIIRVTLVAGFASSLAFPLGAFLAAHWGWRSAFAGFGLIDLVLAAPVMAWAGRRLRRLERAGQARRVDAPGRLREAMRQPRFWLLAGIFACGWGNHTMLVTFFIPLFSGLGATAALAVAAASTVGPFQVVGRLVLMGLGPRAAALGSTRVSYAMMVGAGLILFAAGAAPMLIFAFAMMQGAAIGLMSILRPLLTAEQMGVEGFGAISGALSTAPLLANAAAPLLGAALFGLGGPFALILGSLVVGALGLGFTLALPRRPA